MSEAIKGDSDIFKMLRYRRGSRQLATRIDEAKSEATESPTLKFPGRLGTLEKRTILYRIEEAKPRASERIFRQRFECLANLSLTKLNTLPKIPALTHTTSVGRLTYARYA